MGNKNAIKILQKIKNKLLGSKALTESQYYENLFIKNVKWNSLNPNEDELKRWEAIEYLIKSHVEMESDLEILDLGCGRGWLTNLLTKYGKTIGVEPVKKVVEYAKKIFPEITFYSGYAEDLLKKGVSESFDLIVSSEVIEHIPDNLKPEFALSINKLLKKNGYVIITTPRKEAQEEWLKFFGANQPIEEWVEEKQLELLFNQNGFKSIELKRTSVLPIKDSSLIEIYQIWLFKKK